MHSLCKPAAVNLRVAGGSERGGERKEAERSVRQGKKGEQHKGATSNRVGGGRAAAQAAAPPIYIGPVRSTRSSASIVMMLAPRMTCMAWGSGAGARQA